MRTLILLSQLGIRMLLAELSGMYRRRIRFVPFYSKYFLAQVMEIYYDQISLYKVCVFVNIVIIALTLRP